MKKLLFTITLSLLISYSFAQWEWQNPLPQGNSIYGICFIDENNGWAVGWGTIMNTNDGGFTWNIKESGFAEGYYDLMLKDVCFTDALNGWIVGGMPGFILHTIDGGQTWSSVQAGVSRLPSALTDVYFTNQQTGWVLGWAASLNGVFIHRTVDGGITWDRYTVCEGTSPYDGSIYFTDNLKGWVAWGNRIMYTVDGGINWETQFDERSMKLNDIYFSDYEHGWVVGTEGTVMITSNCGENWELSTDELLSGTNLSAVSFINNSTGWIGGSGVINEVIEAGIILKTMDSGYTWEEQLNNTSPISCLTFENESGGYAAGDHGLLLKATNDGNNWNIISSGFAGCDFKDVFFTDQLNGWVSGEDSYMPVSMPDPEIFHTNDGGITWERQNLPTNESGGCYKIFFSDNQHGWSFGYSLDGGFKYLICTIDGGDNWEVQLTEDNVSADIYFINNSAGWKVGSNGAIQKTEDGGWNWIDQQSGTDRNLNSIIFVDEDNGWIAGDSIILHTNDGGVSWQEQSDTLSFWSNIFFIDELHGWVVNPGRGDGGISMKTIDGGISWEVINAGFLEVYFIDTDNGWGRSVTYPGGTGGSSPPAYNMWYTNDGGSSWEIQPTPVLIEGGFCFVDEDNGWAVSSNGAILNTKNGGFSDDCLLDGIEFATQEQIDDFQTDYPGCTEIEGNVRIGGDNITNLNGIDVLTTIGGNLWIGDNNVLTNLTGLDSLKTIGGDLGIMDNSLKSLTGLNDLTQIAGYIFISGNDSLTSLAGLNNIDDSSITDLIITYNDNLSTCEVQSVCDYLVSPNGTIEIHDNATGCNSQEEVEDACASSINELSTLYGIKTQPNPFTTSTTLSYELQQPEKVTLSIYNQLGQLVYQTEVNQAQGSQQLKWNAERHAEGVYYYRLKVGDAVANGKMVKVK